MDGKIFDKCISYKVLKNGSILSILSGKVLKARGVKPRVSLKCDDGSRTAMSVANMVCYTYHGNGYGRDIIFIDGNKSNVCADNLKWAGEATLLPVDACQVLYHNNKYWLTPDGFVWSTVDIDDGYARRILGTPNSDGYLHVTIGGKNLFIHVLVCRVFHGEKPEPNMHARHLNDNKLDNSKENIAWGTPQQNSNDRNRNGHMPDMKGAMNPSSKLNEDAVREVRRLLCSGVTPPVVARQFNVHATTIRHIDAGKTWQHVT